MYLETLKRDDGLCDSVNVKSRKDNLKLMRCRIGNLFEVYREALKIVQLTWKCNDVWWFRTILGFYVEYMYFDLSIVMK